MKGNMTNSNLKSAIVIGATSGIGRALVEQLVTRGCQVGITGRRHEMLEEIRQKYNEAVCWRCMDVCDTENARSAFAGLAEEMGDIDLVVISAGTGVINSELAWEPEARTISTNVNGFAAMATAAMKLFIDQGYGHLVGISSIGALRGNRDAPAYNASKAFVSNYLEGLRVKAARSRLPIYVTDILPGFVDTAMAQGPGLFWVSTPQKAAEQIMAAIDKRKRRAYITRRWRLIAWLMKALPDFIYERM
ncbi:MAG: short-chain dehydrogenase/reductase SDR [uncultured bacterium]|nr:MAG: short-chain dehydrogenase/reductase SDR [uncultured bacterium]